MNSKITIPSPLQKLDDPLFKECDIEVYVKRDDLIHPEISGNKWRKLKYNFEKFYAGKYDSLLTFGGAFSNHIAAVAAAGRIFNIPGIGIIRGDELTPASNATLHKAKQDGMQLIFVPRDIYEQRYERIYHEELRQRYGNILIVEEGGANFLGVQGVAELINELDFEPDFFYTAAGTGTTAAGLLAGTKRSKIIAVSALKNGTFLTGEIEKLLYNLCFDDDLVKDYMRRFILQPDFHFGGYGKYTAELISFMNLWLRNTGIQLDQVYTGKLFFAFMEDVKAGKIVPGSKTILLHTGGLQGLIEK